MFPDLKSLVATFSTGFVGPGDVVCNTHRDTLMKKLHGEVHNESYVPYVHVTYNAMPLMRDAWACL